MRFPSPWAPQRHCIGCGEAAREVRLLSDLLSSFALSDLEEGSQETYCELAVSEDDEGEGGKGWRERREPVPGVCILSEAAVGSVV